MKILRMRALRLQYGVSSKWMAELVGLDPGQYCRIETGWYAKVNEKTNEKLIRVFGEGFDTLKEIVEIDDPEEAMMERIRNGGFAA